MTDKKENLQPQGSERYFIAEIIGHDNLMKLDNAGYKVRHRNKIVQKQVRIATKLKDYQATIISLSTLLSQLGAQLNPVRPIPQDPSDM